MSESRNHWWQEVEWSDVAVVMLLVMLVLMLLILALAIDHPLNLD